MRKELRPQLCSSVGAETMSPHAIWGNHGSYHPACLAAGRRQPHLLRTDRVHTAGGFPFTARCGRRCCGDWCSRPARPAQQGTRRDDWAELPAVL